VKINIVIILVLILTSCDNLRKAQESSNRNERAKKLVKLEPKLQDRYNLYYVDLKISKKELLNLFKHFLSFHPEYTMDDLPFELDEETKEDIQEVINDTPKKNSEDGWLD
jgi:hypothetical protein